MAKHPQDRIHSLLKLRDSTMNEIRRMGDRSAPMTKAQKDKAHKLLREVDEYQDTIDRLRKRL